MCFNHCVSSHINIVILKLKNRMSPRPKSYEITIGGVHCMNAQKTFMDTRPHIDFLILIL